MFTAVNVGSDLAASLTLRSQIENNAVPVMSHSQAWQFQRYLRTSDRLVETTKSSFLTPLSHCWYCRVIINAVYFSKLYQLLKPLYFLLPSYTCENHAWEKRGLGLFGPSFETKIFLTPYNPFWIKIFWRIQCRIQIRVLGTLVWGNYNFWIHSIAKENVRILCRDFLKVTLALLEKNESKVKLWRSISCKKNVQYL